MRALLDGFAAWMGGTLRASEVATDAPMAEGRAALASDGCAAAGLSERAAARAVQRTADEVRWLHNTCLFQCRLW